MEKDARLKQRTGVEPVVAETVPAESAAVAEGEGLAFMGDVPEACQVLMAAGALQAGKARRERWEIEDLILLGRIKESGGYVQALELAGLDTNGRAWDTYCRLIGWREKTLNEKLAALREFGVEVMRSIAAARIPHVGIKALLDAPGELREELRVKRGALTTEDLRSVLDRVEAAHARADRERARAEQKQAELDKTSKELDKTKDKLIEAQQDARDAGARLKVIEQQKKVTNAREIARMMDGARKDIENACGKIGLVNVNADDNVRASAAEFVGELQKIEEEIHDLRVSLQREILG